MIVFWDYDTQWGADRSRSGGGAKEWGGWSSRTPNGCSSFTPDTRSRPASPWWAPRLCPVRVRTTIPTQIRRIHEAGHEVGSHSFHHEWLPGLSAEELRTTLRTSRDALEQCIGAAVTTFVPPFNQPVDYPAGLSFSLAERRQARPHRNDVGDLCRALAETGYATCRVSYRSLPQRLLEKGLRRRLDRPRSPVTIGGIRCLRLSCASGFDDAARALVEKSADEGGLVVVYGHPHSLHGGDPQDEIYLTPFLGRLSELVRAGAVRACLPSEFDA